MWQAARPLHTPLARTTRSYVITRRLVITQNLTLRGAGQGSTTLLFPYSLTEVYGNNPTPPKSTEYAFGPGWVHWQGPDWVSDTTAVANVMGAAKRGSFVLTLDTAPAVHKLAVGEWIVLTMDGSAQFINDRNGGYYAPGCYDRLCVWPDLSARIYRWTSRVAGVAARTGEGCGQLLIY